LDDAAVTNIKKELDYTAPFLVMRSDLVKSLITPTEGSAAKLPGTLARWQKAVVGHDTYSQHGVVVSALNPSMGRDELATFFGQLVPPASRVTSQVPSHTAAVESIKLCGESPAYSNFDFEPNLLGTIRIQVTGMSRYLMVSTDLFVKALDEDEGFDIAKTQLTELANILKRLTVVELPRRVPTLAATTHTLTRD
jgi:hypothetical protein